MSQFAALGAALLLALYATAVPAQPLGFGMLILDWPEDWTVGGTKENVELAGPDEARAGVQQFFVPSSALPDEIKARKQMLADYPNAFMIRTADKAGGKTLRALQRKALDDKHLLYSVVSQVVREGRTYCLLQYYLLGPRGSTYFSIAARGDPAGLLAEFDPVFETPRWRD